jgi:4a-hydroxytetrahydrobiopterin dehydratase
MNVLSKNEVLDLLTVNLKEWSFKEDCIIRDLKFKTFIEAFSFMTEVALEAEKMNHHPDWSNLYNTVKIKLSTHDANGITQKDIELATKIDEIQKKYV